MTVSLPGERRAESTDTRQRTLHRARRVAEAGACLASPLAGRSDVTSMLISDMLWREARGLGR